MKKRQRPTGQRDRVLMDAIRFMTAAQLDRARKGADRAAQVARKYEPKSDSFLP